MIRTSVKLTTLPFTRGPADVPTVDVWSDDGDDAGALVHAHLVATAARARLKRGAPAVGRIVAGTVRVTVELPGAGYPVQNAAMGALLAAVADVGASAARGLS